AFFDMQRDAMLDGADVLWPEKEDYYTLMELRIREGVFSFDSEKQNEPINPADSLFASEDFHFWDDEHQTVEDLLQSIPHRWQLFAGCDPSLGKLGRNRDDSAIILLLRDWETGTLYVIDADIARRKPDEIIEAVLQRLKLWNIDAIGIESVQFQ